MRHQDDASTLHHSLLATALAVLRYDSGAVTDARIRRPRLVCDIAVRCSPTARIANDNDKRKNLRVLMTREVGNVRGQARRVHAVRHGTEAQSRRCLHHAGSALFRQISSVTKIMELDQQAAQGRLSGDLATNLHLAR